MINIIKNSINRIKENYIEYLFTNAMIQVIKTIILIPLYSFILVLALKKSKVFAFTNNNIMSLLKNPIALIIGLIGVFIMMISIFYEIGYYFLLADNQIKEREYSVRSMLGILRKKSKYLLSFNSIILVLYLILLLPLANIGLISNIGLNLKIPDFITDELLNTTYGPYIYFGLLFILTIITIKLIYTIYFFVTEKNDRIFDAVKKSWKFSKGRVIKNIILILGASIFFGIFILIIIFIAMSPLIVSEKIYPGISWLTSAISLTLAQIAFIFLGGLLQPLIVNIIVETAEIGENNNLTEKNIKSKPEKRLEKLVRKITNRKSGKILIGLIPVVFLIGNIMVIQSTVYKPVTAVIAHRGYMDKAVENSLEGVIEAAKVGADMVELDVQETKDGNFIIMHDYTLKRLAKVDKNIYDLTLAEIENIELTQNGYKAKIPTLEEFIDLAKEENIDLLVEVKPHGHESSDMERNFVNILKEKNVIDKYIVQSLDLDTLDRIKEIDEDITTCYIIPFLLGNLPKTEHDYICIEDFSASERLIKEANEEYEGILVWTINKEELMKKYFALNVNGIITNNPELALKLRNELDENSFFTRIEYLLEN